jgi:predicted DNA-binding protein
MKKPVMHRIELQISNELATLLEELSRKTGRTPSEIFKIAIGLYGICLRESLAGKSVAVVDAENRISHHIKI